MALVLLFPFQSESSSQTGSSSSDSDSESTLGSSDEDFEEQLKKVKGVKCEGVRVLEGMGEVKRSSLLPSVGCFSSVILVFHLLQTCTHIPTRTLTCVY